MVYRDFNITSNREGGNFNVLPLQDGVPVKLFSINGFYDVAQDSEVKYFEGKGLEDALEKARKDGLSKLIRIELKRIN